MTFKNANILQYLISMRNTVIAHKVISWQVRLLVLWQASQIVGLAAHLATKCYNLTLINDVHILHESHL